MSFLPESNDETGKTDFTNHVNRTSPEIERLLSTSARCVFAARNGNEEAFMTLLALADQLCDGVESVRVLNPEMARKFARAKATWPCLVRNRPECIRDMVAALKDMELGRGHPAASHVTTIPRRKGQRATAYLNRLAEDALKDVNFLRSESSRHGHFDLATAAGMLPELTSADAADAWAHFAFEGICATTHDTVFDQPEIQIIFERGRLHYLRKVRAAAKRTQTRARLKGDEAAEWRTDSVVAHRLGAAEKTARQEGIARVRLEFFRAFRRVCGFPL